MNWKSQLNLDQRVFLILIALVLPAEMEHILELKRTTSAFSGEEVVEIIRRHLATGALFYHCTLDPPTSSLLIRQVDHILYIHRQKNIDPTLLTQELLQAYLKGWERRQAKPSGRPDLAAVLSLMTKREGTEP